jgi:hypothetical protein
MGGAILVVKFENCCAAGGFGLGRQYCRCSNHWKRLQCYRYLTFYEFIGQSFRIKKTTAVDGLLR